MIGKRKNTSYHTKGYIVEIIRQYFKIVTYYDGLEHPEKMGGQDLWILQKI